MQSESAHYHRVTLATSSALATRYEIQAKYYGYRFEGSLEWNDYWKMTFDWEQDLGMKIHMDPPFVNWQQKLRVSGYTSDEKLPVTAS